MTVTLNAVHIWAKVFNTSGSRKYDLYDLEMTGNIIYMRVSIKCGMRKVSLVAIHMAADCARNGV